MHNQKIKYLDVGIIRGANTSRITIDSFHILEYDDKLFSFLLSYNGKVIETIFIPLSKHQDVTTKLLELRIIDIILLYIEDGILNNYKVVDKIKLAEAKYNGGI